MIACIYRGGCWYDSRAQAGVEYRDFSASHGGQPDFGVRLVYTELQVDT